MSRARRHPRRGEYSEILQKVFTKTFYHEVKMLAPWHFYEAVNVEGAEISAQGRMPRNIAESVYEDILPRSKNACLQGHFYEAVNVEGAEISAQGRMPRNIAKQYFPKTL